jgi:hypothetical protein
VELRPDDTLEWIQFCLSITNHLEAQICNMDRSERCKWVTVLGNMSMNLDNNSQIQLELILKTKHLWSLIFQSSSPSGSMHSFGESGIRILAALHSGLDDDSFEFREYSKFSGTITADTTEIYLQMLCCSVELDMAAIVASDKRNWKDCRSIRSFRVLQDVLTRGSGVVPVESLSVYVKMLASTIQKSCETVAVNAVSSSKTSVCVLALAIMVIGAQLLGGVGISAITLSNILTGSRNIFLAVNKLLTDEILAGCSDMVEELLASFNTHCFKFVEQTLSAGSQQLENGKLLNDCLVLALTVPTTVAPKIGADPSGAKNILEGVIMLLTEVFVSRPQANVSNLELTCVSCVFDPFWLLYF